MKNATSLTLASLVMAGLISCSQAPSDAPSAPSTSQQAPGGPHSDEPEGSAPPGIPLALVRPYDLTSAAGTTPPSIVVFQSLGGLIGPLLVEAGAAAHLVTWPEGAEIAADRVVSDPAGSGATASITLVPKAPLSDRWYQLRVDSLPKGIVWHPTAYQTRHPDGSATTRFRPGSDAQVARVTLCQKPTLQEGIVTFSERIDTGTSPAPPLSFDRADCRYLPQPIPTGRPDKDADTTIRDLWFRCDTYEDVTVTLNAGVKSKSGVAVPAKTFALTRSAMTSIGNCTYLQL